MRINLKWAFSLLFIAMMSLFAFAQETRSSIEGVVLETGNKSIANAEVVATHEPTGTVYKTVTNSNGNFVIKNMNVGGPYTILVKQDGKEIYKEEQVDLKLGESYNVYAFVDSKSKESQTLTDVVVSGKVGAKNKTGADTKINSSMLRSLPNVSGSLSDFVRITPQVRTTDRQIAIAGQNNRYNALYVDGGVSNDVFGLSPSGTDGGQTGANPFALEELDQITVSLAPYDVKQSGFAGGSINAVTKQGSNKEFGSAYYFFRNNSLSGKTAAYLEDDRQELADFTASKWGLSLGGKIIPNKLFYFITFEREDIVTPKPFVFSQFLDQANITQDQLLQLRASMLSKYNYDIGSYDQSQDQVIAQKFIARLDWNINDKHKLTFKYKINLNDYQTDNTSTASTINFSNGSQTIKNNTQNYAMEWNWKINEKMSNSLQVTAKSVVDDRDFTGDPFPKVSLTTLGGRSIAFGPEVFSTANYLEQNQYSIYDNFEWNIDKHNITIGTQHDFFKFKNLFIGNNFGAYTFNNVTISSITYGGFDRFLNYYLNPNGLDLTLAPYNNAAYQNYNLYSRSYSSKNPFGIGDDLVDDAAAVAGYYQMAFYAQDQWKPNRNLTLTAGLRIDIPFYEQTNQNPDFDNIALPKLQAQWTNLDIPKTGTFIDPQIHLSPRVGFNYIFNPDAVLKSQLRGGIGVFTSRAPMVWAGGAYNNTGANLIAVTENQVGTGLFEANPYNQFVGPGQKYGGEVNLFSKDFKLPQRLKFSLGYDQKLPAGFNLTIDGSYDKYINDIRYRNINLRPTPDGYLTGSGDNRPRYNRATLIDPRYTAIYFAENTHEGYAYTIATTLSKKFDFGLMASFSYMYNDAYNTFEGTSSQNSSQWRNTVTVNGKNTDFPEARSEFAIGSRLVGMLSYELKLLDEHLKTTVSLFYEGINGNPFSYVYNTPNGVQLLNDDSSDNALIYIPKDINDINLQDGYQNLSKEYQWDILNKYIESDPYLSKHRGEYAERNSNRTPWSHVIDMRILQDFSIEFGGKKHNLQASFDIFNVTNLLNKDWGLRFNNQNSATGFFSKGLIDVVSVLDNGNGTYTPVLGVNPTNLSRRTIEQYNNSGVSSSVWQIQLGIRYFFK